MRIAQREREREGERGESWVLRRERRRRRRVEAWWVKILNNRF